VFGAVSSSKNVGLNDKETAMAKLSDWLEKQGMTGLRFKTSLLEADFVLKNDDKAAAWEMYIELLTRITTQALPDGDGVEQTALDSVYALFGITRSVIKSNGRGCIEFTKIAVVVLNQVIRPFTARWHQISVADGFDDQHTCAVFRTELQALQVELRIYTAMLADMAGVEDLTDMEGE
jgi:hypothetical protein